MKSKIRVPQHPSLALSSGLAAFCSEVYLAAPHSLPSTTLADLTRGVASTVGRNFAKVAMRSTLDQSVALQLLFDVQLVQQCLVSREWREVSAELQSAASALEKHVDPFDLSVFSPHVSVNVKRAVLRQAGLLGVLIPQDRHALLASMKSSLPAQPQTDQHNVMWAFSHRPERIPLLPVPRRKKRQQPKHLSAAAAALSAPTASSSTSGSSRRARRDRSPAAKAAAATGGFFEAMSTSWFGSKS